MSVTDIVNGQRSRKALRVEYTTVVRPVKTSDAETSDSDRRSGQGPPDDIEVTERREVPGVGLQKVRDVVPATVSGTAGRDVRDAPGLASMEPTEVEDIPVVEEVERVEEAYYDHEYRPIPGGCQMRQARWSGGYCTLGTPAYDHSTNDYVMTTSGHCLDGNDGNAMFQPGGWRTSFGYPEDWIFESGRNDAGYVDTSRLDYDSYKQEKIDFRLATDDGGVDEYINGIIAYDSVKGHQGDSSWTVHKQGRTTGRDSGYITSASDGRLLGRFELDQGVDSDGGDSGGPVFKKYGSSVYIIGHHNWGNRSTDDKEPAGNLMEHIEDEMNIEVNYVV